MSNQNDPKTQKSNSTIAVAKENQMAKGLYFSPAAKMQIANFTPEEKSGGQLIHPEKPLEFSNHVYVTDDVKVMEFIENSNAFKSGQVRKCPTMEELKSLMAQRQARRTHTDVDCVDANVAEK